MRQGGCKEPTNTRIVTTTYRAYLRRRELTSRRFPRPGASVTASSSLPPPGVDPPCPPSMEDFCAVCADTMDWVAYGLCGHREVCSTCVARLRLVMDDKRCCICKTVCPSVFVTKVSTSRV